MRQKGRGRDWRPILDTLSFEDARNLLPIEASYLADFDDAFVFGVKGRYPGP